MVRVFITFFMEPFAVKLKVSVISLEMLILIKEDVLIRIFSTHMVHPSFLSFSISFRLHTAVC